MSDMNYLQYENDFSHSSKIFFVPGGFPSYTFLIEYYIQIYSQYT